MQLQMFLANLSYSPYIPFHLNIIVIYNYFILIRKDAYNQLFDWMVLLNTLFISFKIICIFVYLELVWENIIVVFF